MSMGFGAFANKIIDDGESVLYEYSSYNLNDEKYNNKSRISDGVIIIQKECFIEPEIHKKIKKLPSGKKKRKKLITKIIPVDVDYGAFLEEGKIIIENCSNCWHKVANELQIDEMACHMLYYIFYQYQICGKIPETLELLY